MTVGVGRNLAVVNNLVPAELSLCHGNGLSTRGYLRRPGIRTHWRSLAVYLELADGNVALYFYGTVQDFDTTTRSICDDKEQYKKTILQLYINTTALQQRQLLHYSKNSY